MRTLALGSLVLLLLTACGESVSPPIRHRPLVQGITITENGDTIWVNTLNCEDCHGPRRPEKIGTN